MRHTAPDEESGRAWLALITSSRLLGARGPAALLLFLSMVQAYRAAAGSPTRWGPDRVEVLLVAELPLVSAAGPVSRWGEGRIWRWRALLGLVDNDDMFH